MNWKFVGKLWLSAFVIFSVGCLLVGCGSQRWSPTDPRLDTPDTESVTVDATWEMDISADVDNN